jgi:hypothetical protein
MNGRKEEFLAADMALRAQERQQLRVQGRAVRESSLAAGHPMSLNL